MAKDGSVYSTERAKYKQQFPRSRMHHMHPSSRDGSDEEFNLFPWNEKSHAAWHRMFVDLTVREVWDIISVAWLRIWDNSEEAMPAEWMERYLYVFKKHVQKEICRERRVEEWQQWWLDAFSGDSLERAQCLLRSMMLCMVFGHYAFTDDVFSDARLRELLAELPSRGDRAWAFRTCFGHLPDQVSFHSIKSQIRKIRACTARARR